MVEVHPLNFHISGETKMSANKIKLAKVMREEHTDKLLTKKEMDETLRLLELHIEMWLHDICRDILKAGEDGMYPQTGPFREIVTKYGKPLFGQQAITIVNNMVLKAALKFAAAHNGSK